MSLSMSGRLPLSTALTAHSSRLPYVRVSRDPSCKKPAADLRLRRNTFTQT